MFNSIDLMFTKNLGLLPIFLALGAQGVCTYSSLVAMIPEISSGNLTTNLAVNGQVNDTAEVNAITKRKDK